MIEINLSEGEINPLAPYKWRISQNESILIHVEVSGELNFSVTGNTKTVPYLNKKVVYYFMAFFLEIKSTAIKKPLRKIRAA
jgi:hypothetical protein